MGDNSRFLQQLELILDHDPLIDEVGFLHPSQFATLPKPARIHKCVEENSDAVLIQYDEAVFWYNDHKLAISVDVLSNLYNEAKQRFMELRRIYKDRPNKSIETGTSVLDDSPNSSTGDFLENEILRHSKSLLILSCDFTTAWNSRKLVLLKMGQASLFSNEFQLSTLILSYSPKSEQAWSHRRWIIKSLAERFHNLEGIVGKESELAKKIAERSKMNYRAWKHRCWLTFYLSIQQMNDELITSRKWGELNLADNCCFHYRRQLLYKILHDNIVNDAEEGAINYSPRVYSLWKEELDWTELLIKRYIGREALWIHRRFLSQCWIKHLATNEVLSIIYKNDYDDVSPNLGLFLSEELQLAHSCMKVSTSEFEDTRLQAQHAASYVLFIFKQVPEPYKGLITQKLEELGGLKTLLVANCPERAPLWEGLLN